jgi:rhodanese-related sulfurtransferase
MTKPDYVSASEVRQLLEDPAQKSKLIIIDVRDEDRNEGWIPDSHNWPTTELRSGGTKENEKMMEEFLAKQHQQNGKTLFVWHCMWSQMRGPWACKRAIEAVNGNSSLKSMNLRNVILTGGFMEWRRQCPDLVKK